MPGADDADPQSCRGHGAPLKRATGSSRCRNSAIAAGRHGSAREDAARRRRRRRGCAWHASLGLHRGGQAVILRRRSPGSRDRARGRLDMERPRLDAVFQSPQDRADPRRLRPGRALLAPEPDVRRRRRWLPWRTIHLGLDLRGGSYLLMEVDMSARDQGAARRPRRRRAPGAAQGRHPALHGHAAAAAEPAARARVPTRRSRTRRWRRFGSSRPPPAPASRRAGLEVATAPEGITVTLSPVGACTSAPPAPSSNPSRSFAGASTRPAWSIRSSPPGPGPHRRPASRASRIRTGSRSCSARRRA